MFKVLRNKIFYKNKTIFIAEDFNVNLLDKESHPTTNDFLSGLLAHGLYPLVNKPTRISSNTETLIDNIFSNFELASCKSALLYSDISDHLPILTQCFTSSNQENGRKNSNCKTRRDFSEDGFNKFKSYLSSIDWKLELKHELNAPNKSYKIFLDKFTFGFNKSFPLKSIYIHRKTPRKPWMTKGLVKCCERRSKLFKDAKCKGTEAAKLKFTAYRNKLNSLLKYAEKDYYAKNLMILKGTARRRGEQLLDYLKIPINLLPLIIMNLLRMVP